MCYAGIDTEISGSCIKQKIISNYIQEAAALPDLMAVALES